MQACGGNSQNLTFIKTMHLTIEGHCDLRIILAMSTVHVLDDRVYHQASILNTLYNLDHSVVHMPYEYHSIHVCN